MTRANDIAGLVDANGDIVSGALDNVPPADLVNDTTPQLGGALDAQANNITSVGNLSIGTSSPQHELHIQGSTGTSSLSLKGTGTGTAASDGIELRLQNDNAAYLYNFENAMLRFGTNGLERMRIDASGRVTMPNQPVFTARHASLAGVNFTSGHSEMGSGFWYAAYEQDNGNHFNGSTGRFTAPVAGYYFFSHHCRTDVFSGSYLYHSIMKNGSSLVARNLSSQTYTYNTKACSGLTYLAVNDYVSTFTQSTGDTSINFDADGFFSGFLIG